MSKFEKAISRLLSCPKDYTWDELIAVLKSLGYEEQKGGKTGGSRRKFVDSSLCIISLHKPHPSNIVKGYALKEVIAHLKEKHKV
jgi:HicA toxin of bacterial toxin-antitoxin,